MPREVKPVAAPAAEKKPVSDWVRAKDPEAWKLAGAVQAGKWELEVGFPLLTESEFDAAIKAVGDIRIG